MIKTIIRAFYSFFIVIVLFFILLGGWTAYSFIYQPSKSDEILRVIKDIYGSQKSVIFDYVKLTNILINEDDLSKNNDNINSLFKKDLLTVGEDNSQLNESSISRDNSLEMDIEPSSNEFGEEILPRSNEEPIVTEEIESSKNEISRNGY